MKFHLAPAGGVLMLISAGVIAWTPTSNRLLIESRSAPRTQAALETRVIVGPVSPIPTRRDLPKAKVDLGFDLFHDPILSRDQTLSCSSCHDVKNGGDDGRAFSVGTDGSVGGMHSPTVLNAVFNVAQFWDGRAPDLRQQIDGPLTNPLELASDWDTVVSRLRSTPPYPETFQSIYQDGITPDNVRDAIATYEESLTTPNSPFDRFLRGDRDALSPLARNGWKTFQSLGCVTCHQGVNLGGNMFQKMGFMSDYYKDRQPREAEFGRYNVTKQERDKFRYKVPTLRNIALTAPYFHDGSVPDLKEAIRMMARVQLGSEISEADVSQLTAFLESLTGEQPSR